MGSSGRRQIWEGERSRVCVDHLVSVEYNVRLCVAVHVHVICIGNQWVVEDWECGCSQVFTPPSPSDRRHLKCSRGLVRMWIARHLGGHRLRKPLVLLSDVQRPRRGGYPCWRRTEQRVRGRMRVPREYTVCRWLAQDTPWRGRGRGGGTPSKFRVFLRTTELTFFN